MTRDASEGRNMIERLRRDTKDALAAFEKSLAGGRKTVDHHLVRAILVPLGFLIEAGEDTGAELERLGALIERRRQAWENALRFELKLAVSEHVLSVDLRFLNRPDYDFDYTLRARDRLQARLTAADALDMPAPGALVKQVKQADAILEPYLRSREGEEPAN